MLREQLERLLVRCDRLLICLKLSLIHLSNLSIEGLLLLWDFCALSSGAEHLEELVPRSKETIVTVELLEGLWMRALIAKHSLIGS